MSWMQRLAETYDNCQAEIGYAPQTSQRPLLPICHITARAHIEIVIDGDGNFRRARAITDRDDSTTIIPSTEGSASRAGSKPENHPLCDKLQYVAGDYTMYGGAVTSGFSKDSEEPYRNFVRTLTAWCVSGFAHPKARAVLAYVEKKTVVADLVRYQILLVGEDGKLSAKKEVKRDKNAKDIFAAVNPQEQEAAFVRWVVEMSGENESRDWRDKTLWESWTKYYLGNLKDEDLCLVTGENQAITNNHPKYIRAEGDGAKLISANDTSGFTFRGRFLTDQQACTVGLVASHKAHYALSWLISRQGFREGDLAIVAWASSGAPVPQPTADTFTLFDELVAEPDARVDTAQEVAIKLKKRIAGYGREIGKTDRIGVIALDSATPGRLAITYYRDLTGSDFLSRLDDWHEACAWRHTYRYVDVQNESGKPMKKRVAFIGAPAPKDIAEAVYATNNNGDFRLDGKIAKITIARLLPCIIDGQPIPRDLVEAAVRRASNRVAFDERQWNKILTIACALFRHQNRWENHDMALDLNRKTRDYLYGRLLALADSLEEWALNEAHENRPTNAARLMQRFAERPFSTWRTLELALTPYKARLGGKSKKRQRMIDEVVAAFDENDFISDRRLSGEFLLGYHSQREYLRPVHEAADVPAAEDPETASN